MEERLTDQDTSKHAYWNNSRWNEKVQEPENFSRKESGRSTTTSPELDYFSSETDNNEFREIKSKFNTIEYLPDAISPKNFTGKSKKVSPVKNRVDPLKFKVFFFFSMSKSESDRR